MTRKVIEMSNSEMKSLWGETPLQRLINFQFSAHNFRMVRDKNV